MVVVVVVTTGTGDSFLVDHKAAVAAAPVAAPAAATMARVTLDMVVVCEVDSDALCYLCSGRVRYKDGSTCHE